MAPRCDASFPRFATRRGGKIRRRVILEHSPKRTAWRPLDLFDPNQLHNFRHRLPAAAKKNPSGTHIVTNLPIQPIACVIGHPIAGNPTQFAIEKAFAAADLDWRFLSVDVAKKDLRDAIRGIRAMGFRGAWIAEPHRQCTASLCDWLSEEAQLAGHVDLLICDDGQLKGYHVKSSVVLPMVGRLIPQSPSASSPTPAANTRSADDPSGGVIAGDDGDVNESVPVATQTVPRPAKANTISAAAESPPLGSDVQSGLEDASEINGATTSSSPVPSENAIVWGHDPTLAAMLGPLLHHFADLQWIMGPEPQELACTPALTPSVHAQINPLIDRNTKLLLRGWHGTKPAVVSEALLERIEGPALVIDFTDTSTSPLARRAAQCGLQALTRLDLLSMQMVKSLRLLTAAEIDSVVVRDALEEYLEI